MVRRTVAVVATLSVVIVACGGSTSRAVAVAAVGGGDSGGAAHCPDLAQADELAALDFGNEFALAQPTADRLKAVTLTAAEVTKLEAEVDGDLGIACAQMARGLGGSGEWHAARDACAAAREALRDARAKLGPRAVTRLVTRPPICASDASAMTRCASICDASVPADRARAACEDWLGRCDGSCAGVCERKSPGRCAGTCAGTCDGSMRGTCGGRCQGRCDGKPSRGACAGVCTGRCERGPIEGECKGGCAGACTMSAPAICDGTCVGGCSVELTNARCSRQVKTPAVSAACRSRCELARMNDTQCSAPDVGLVVTSPASKEAADAMVAALGHALPRLSKVLAEVGPAAVAQVREARAAIDVARADLASATARARCFDEPFAKASAAAANVEGALVEAVALKEEATSLGR